MLEMFLGSLSRADFLEAYWGQRSFQSSSPGLLELRPFGLADLVKIVAFLRPCDGRVRIVQDGEESWAGDLRDEGVFSLVTGALSRGMTVTLERLDLFWPPVVELCGTLSAELGCAVHANAYLTPAGEAGLRPHYDTHDVFVLQLEGEKSWCLGQIEAPLPTEQTADGVVTDMRTETRLRVRPGDVLYVPRGMAHSARSEASHSLHLTIGCIPYTFGDELARLVVAAARQIPALRSSVEPSPASLETRRAQVSSLVGEMARLIDTGALQPPLRRRSSRPERPSRLDDALSQLRAALDLAGISSASTFALTQVDDAELIAEGDAFVLRSGARSVQLDAELVPAARAVIAMPGVFSLSDLPPGTNKQHALRVIVRLVSASFLRVVA